MSSGDMDIAVISLADADARRASVSAQMAAAGLAFRFSEAVSTVEEAETLAGQCDGERFLLNTGRWPVPAELGCYASHLALWRECAEAGRPILVMEDDFRLRPVFTKAVDTVSRLVRDAGFVRLQAESRAVRRPVRAVGPFTLVHYRKMTQGAMCYAIGPRVAEAFLRASRGVAAPVDVFIKRYWDHGQRLFGLLPYAVETADVAWPSQIGDRRKAGKGIRRRLRRSLHMADGWFRRHHFNVRDRTHPLIGVDGLRRRASQVPEGR